LLHDNQEVSALVEQLKKMKAVRSIGLQVAEIKVAGRESEHGVLHCLLYVQGKSSDTKIYNKTIENIVQQVDALHLTLHSWGVIEDFPRFPVYADLYGEVLKRTAGGSSATKLSLEQLMVQDLIVMPADKLKALIVKLKVKVAQQQEQIDYDKRELKSYEHLTWESLYTKVPAAARDESVIQRYWETDRDFVYPEWIFVADFQTRLETYLSALPAAPQAARRAELACHVHENIPNEVYDHYYEQDRQLAYVVRFDKLCQKMMNDRERLARTAAQSCIDGIIDVIESRIDCWSYEDGSKQYYDCAGFNYNYMDEFRLDTFRYAEKHVAHHVSYSECKWDKATKWQTEVIPAQYSLQHELVVCDPL
jgi:hypothetical protein